MHRKVWNEYYGGDRHQDNMNTYHLRGRTSEEKTADGCIRGAITELRQDYRSTLLLERGLSGVNSYEIGESSHGTGVPDPTYGAGPMRKFYAQELCKNAQKCRFPQYSAHQSQMGNEPLAMPTIHNIFRYGGENLGSHGTFSAGNINSKQFQSTQNLQSVDLNVQSQHHISQGLPVVPYQRSADMVGARIDQNRATSEYAGINPNLAQDNSNAPLIPGPLRKQSSKRNRDPRLVSSSSAAHPSVPFLPNQQGVMVQPETSVLSGRKVLRFEIAIDSNGNPEILSHSEGNKGESKGIAHAKETDMKKTNEQKMFKSALVNFVKEGLKETWHGGHLTKELYKVIVRKVVEKIMCSEKTIPKTKQMINIYFKLYKKKIDRLIQDYLGKYTNLTLRH